MTIRDLKIGDKFRVIKDGLVYVKETVQGMNDNYSYCYTDKMIKNKTRYSRYNKLFHQDTIIVKENDQTTL